MKENKRNNKRFFNFSPPLKKGVGGFYLEEITIHNKKFYENARMSL